MPPVKLASRYTSSGRFGSNWPAAKVTDVGTLRRWSRLLRSMSGWGLLGSRTVLWITSVASSAVGSPPAV